MGNIFTRALEGTIDRLVKWIVLPVTGVIPLLVSTGILLAVFVALWIAFGVALVANPGALDDAWRQIGALPLPAIGLLWLLFMPLMAGLWIWTTAWPLAVRLVLVAALAGWNVLVFLPHRGATVPVSDGSAAPGASPASSGVSAAPSAPTTPSNS